MPVPVRPLNPYAPSPSLPALHPSPTYERDTLRTHPAGKSLKSLIFVFNSSRALMFLRIKDFRVLSLVGLAVFNSSLTVLEIGR